MRSEAPRARKVGRDQTDDPGEGPGRFVRGMQDRKAVEEGDTGAAGCRSDHRVPRQGRLDKAITVDYSSQYGRFFPACWSKARSNDPTVVAASELAG